MKSARRHRYPIAQCARTTTYYLGTRSDRRTVPAPMPRDTRWGSGARSLLHGTPGGAERVEQP
jgi:hypothetical protein